MQGVYKNIEQYNPVRKCKVFIVFDGTISDMISNKKLNQIVTELYIRAKKTKDFYCFYHAILFHCTKRYYAKVYLFFFFQNLKQTRASTNCI